jgi:hypothetical protein
MNGPCRLEPIEGPESRENDPCMPGFPDPNDRICGPLNVGPRLAACPITGELEVARPEPSDLSRPSSRLLAIGETSRAAVTAITAARDLILFVNILLLLPWLPGVRRRDQHQKP